MKHFGLAIMLVVLSLSSHATAQELASEQFQLQTLDYGPAASSVYGVSSSDLPAHLEPAADFVLEYSKDPAVAKSPNGDEISVVGDRWYLDLGVAVGIVERLQLDARLGAVLLQTGSNFAALLDGDDATPVRSSAFGDLRLGVTYRLLQRGVDQPFGVAVRAVTWIPSGATEGFASDGVVRVEPRVIGDLKAGDFLLSANVAYQFRGERIARNFRSDDVIRWGLAATYEPSGFYGAELALFGSHSPFPGRDRDRPTLEAPNSQAHPVEVAIGPFWRARGFLARIGVGRALTEGVGAPELRLLVSLAYRGAGATGAGADEAGEGWRPGGVKGGLQDADEDSIPDDVDECPYEAEDLDQFEDEDGCPELDDDSDGIPDADDACRTTPGVPEKAGCPLVDADADGIDDTEDACPQEPEDVDDFEDQDGCPDPDNDADGVLDSDDKCPNEAEVVNGNEDEDGCPDEGESLVSLRGDRIEILQRVYFDTNRATIKQRSFGVLEQVAAVLKNRPEIRKLKITGHTDDRGGAGYNLDLSRRRARAVMEFLTSRGVDEERLSSVGYGESHPIEDNGSEDGRAANRRVEFLIVRQDETAGGAQ